MSAFWCDLPLFFDWLYDELQLGVLPESKHGFAKEAILQPQADYFSNHSILYKIQFAAANRVCIKLLYSSKERTVEPITFRTARNGDKLFYGYEHEAGHPKAYKLDNIESVTVTNLQYSDEHYPVEITQAGTVMMPPLVRKKQLSSKSLRKSDLPYKLQCPVCYKVFHRKSMNNQKLNKHKNQLGNICFGNFGAFSL